MPSGPAQVLLIDDEPPLLKMMGVYLKRRGFTVVTANSTEQGWELFSISPTDVAVAVIDATLEGMGTDELARRMLQENPALRIVIASGYPVNVEALDAMAPGHVLFLQKPFSPEMLAATVGKMLAGEEEKEV